MIKEETVEVTGKRLAKYIDGREVGHVYVYFKINDLHSEPHSFLEDLWVEETYRNQGVGKKLIQEAIWEAHHRGCYKMILTSRTGQTEDHIHDWYVRLGFRKHGIEFRLNF